MKKLYVTFLLWSIKEIKKRGIIPQSDLIVLRYGSYLLHFHNE